MTADPPQAPPPPGGLDANHFQETVRSQLSMVMAQWSTWQTRAAMAEAKCATLAGELAAERERADTLGYQLEKAQATVNRLTPAAAERPPQALQNRSTAVRGGSRSDSPTEGPGPAEALTGPPASP